MKKIIALFISLVMLISISSGFMFNVYAAGFTTYASYARLNTVYTDSAEYSDPTADFGEMFSSMKHYDAYKFYVPAKGKIILNRESESGEYNTAYTIYMYSSKNLTKNLISEGVFSSNLIDYGYNAGEGVYYDKYGISLSKGTYYVLFEHNQGVGAYKGDDYSFSLNYKPTFGNSSITKLTKKKKAFTVKWKRISSANGYQLQYSTKQNMKGAKTKTYNKNSITSKTINSLKRKKNYYVRVRTFKKVRVEGKNKTYYGKWSGKKVVKTK